MTKRALTLQADGSLPGLTVVGFHGEVLADETPAKLGPVYADEHGCHARITEVGSLAPGSVVRIESYPPALPPEGEPLPGSGTRIGPWTARPGNVVIAVGPEERRLIAQLERAARERGVGRVPRFVQWFAGNEGRSRDLSCERQEGIAIWYCSEAEGFFLFECVHGVVQDEFFRAVMSKSSTRITDMAWWLSRAAIDDQDIYLAAAALRRVVSPAWRVVLRELLKSTNEESWNAGLDDANALLDNPPLVKEVRPPLYKYRDSTRERFLPKAA